MYESYKKCPNALCLALFLVSVILGVIVAVMEAICLLPCITAVIPYAFAFELGALLILAVGVNKSNTNYYADRCDIKDRPVWCCAKCLVISAIAAILLLGLIISGLYLTSCFVLILLIFLTATAVLDTMLSLAAFLCCLVRM